MFSFPQDAYISHLSPGRLRIKIPSRKRCEAFFSTLKTQLIAIPGISEVEVNNLTGSILLLHHIDTKTITALARSNNLFSDQKTLISSDNQNSIRKEIRSTFKQIDSQVQKITSGQMDLRSLVLLSLLGIGIYQVSKGSIAVPAWYVAFWYAFQLI